jgi:hypothetical protein
LIPRPKAESVVLSQQRCFCYEANLKQKIRALKFSIIYFRI